MVGALLVAYMAFGSVAHSLDTAAKNRIAERARMPEVSEYRAVTAHDRHPPVSVRPVVTWSCTATLMDGTEAPCGSPVNRSADEDVRSRSALLRQ